MILDDPLFFFCFQLVSVCKRDTVRNRRNLIEMFEQCCDSIGGIQNFPFITLGNLASSYVMEKSYPSQSVDAYTALHYQMEKLLNARCILCHFLDTA